MLIYYSKSPEIQSMYSLNMPVSAIRTKVRQEFERHRYVNQLKVVDVLLFQSHSEFQVRRSGASYWEEEGLLGLIDGLVDWLTLCLIGNVELLEATVACHEVLQGGRDTECTFAK